MAHFKSIHCRLFLLFTLFLPSAVHANDSVDLGWSSSGRISLVHNQGNGDFTAAGVDLSFHHQWVGAGLDLSLGTVQAQNQTLGRRAVGSPDRFTVEENIEEEKIEENWSVAFSYDHKLSRKFSWVTHGGWERDEPGGFRNRYGFGMGLGVQSDPDQDDCLKTIFSLTWNRQENLVNPGNTDPEFPGFRWLLGYNRPINEHTGFSSTLSYFGNLDDLDDFRTDWSNTLTVSINDWLALEIEAQWKHGSRPPLELIPLIDPSGGSNQLVAAPLDKNESHLALAFVFHH